MKTTDNTYYLDLKRRHIMNIIFLKDCAADGCYKRNVGNGSQMCKKHQDMYNKGIPFTAFYGKTVLKKEFQNTKPYINNNEVK